MKFSQVLQHPLFKSSIIYTFCDAINKGVPFLILPFLSYYLTPSDYGIVANFNILLAVATILISCSVDGVISVNFYKISKEELSKYVYNSLILIVCGGISLLIIVYIFKDFLYDSFRVPFNYIVLAILMAFASIITSINLGLWRLEEKPLKFGIYEIGQTIVNIGVSLLLVVSYQMGWIGRITGIAVGSFSFGFFSLVLLWKRGYLKIQKDKSTMISILVFGLPLVPHLLSMWIRSGIDRLYIGRFYGEEAIGLYATGFQFGVLISFMTLAFNNAFAPFLYKSLSENDVDKLVNNKVKLRKITYYCMIGLVIMASVFYICSLIILKYFFNSTYSGASVYILWAIIAQVFQGFYLLFVNYIFYVKRTKGLALITFSCSLLQVIVSFFLIQGYGPVGGAYSTTIVSLVNFILVAFYSSRVYSMNWIIKK